MAVYAASLVGTGPERDQEIMRPGGGIASIQHLVHQAVKFVPIKRGSVVKGPVGENGLNVDSSQTAQCKLR